MLTARLLLTAVFLANLFSFDSLLLAAPPDEDDEEFRPGLVAEYRVGERAVTRIDPDVAFAWDEAAPDARLSAERFEATWRGFLLVRQEAKHRLHAFVHGDVTVELDGRRVLHGSAKQPQWISGDEFVPGFAERPLVVTFRKTEKAAQLKLFWSSDTLSLEPLPPELLFHDKPRDDLALIELGRKQFEAFRCGRCHQRGGEEQPPLGSSLKNFAASGVFNDQVSEHFGFGTQEPDQVYPRFYLHDPSRDAVEAFLFDQSQPVELEKPKSVKEADLETERRKGEVLLRSTGCLACHRVGELGGTSPSPFAGPDLSNLGERRTLPWLVTWLAKPERLNADHRMPVFNLTDAERNQLALALWRLNGSEAKEPPPGLTEVELTNHWKNWSSFKAKKDETQQAHYKAIVERGRKAIVERRCAACHRFSDDNSVRIEKPASDLSQPVTDWSKSCLAANSDYSQNIRPVFGEKLNRDAIKAFLASRRETKLSPHSTFARGQTLLEQKGCLACHSRHGLGGIGKMAAQVAKFDKDLNGLAPSLVPPSLNAVGDKLLDEALSIAVRGERQSIRMPWLKVRMPKFKHSPDELTMLTRYFVEHDRIPYETRGGDGETRRGGERQKTTHDLAVLSPSPPLPVSPSTETHLAGQALTGVRGWSCIACHKIGDYEPKQVALGARGSDLKMLGKHIRPEFFFRWIASPLRVIPGVEMPQYNRPVAGVLDGDLAKQHAALWQALNDPNFQSPTNPNNVEQLFVVNPGERPRIIRDVFQLPKEFGGGNVPRSLAVGFSNGHSLLFDAETASVRQWTFGDFARQQVVGKRWFWQMAGVDVFRSLPSPQFALRRKSDPKAHVLMASTRTFEPMGNCRVDQLGVHLSYFLYFIVDEQPGDLGPEYAAIRVDESLTPIANDPSRSGVQRRLNLTWTNSENTADFELWFARPSNMAGVGEPRIELVGRSAFGRLPVTAGQQESKVKTQTGKSARPTWQRLSVRDRLDEAWEWTELPMRHSPAESLPTTQVTLTYTAELQRQPLAIPTRPIVSAAHLAVASVPGFEGAQLPLDASIMPTGFAWRPSGSLVLSSLKGHVFAASDSNGDGLEDRLQLLHEGLSAPYGVHVLDEALVKSWCGKSGAHIRDSLAERSVLVASRQDLALLIDLDGDGFCEFQQRLAGDWGLTDDYHEWTTSPVRDSKGNLFWGLSSDYTDKNRPKDRSRWRGKVLKQILDSRGEPKEGPSAIGPHPIGHAFRYPTGIAINDRDEVFVSDQQGVQNCFNEINYLVEGAHYGVASTHEEDKDAPETKAAIQIPHPWTRSVNGLVFLTGKEGYPDLKGHGIGCEYNGRFLIRFTTQRVGDVMQGAVYPFSMTDDELVRGLNSTATPLGATNAIEVSGGKPAAPRQRTVPNFEGPLCCGVSPKGEIYIGSIADSGWAGGQNTGSIVKLRGNGQRPNGIREIRATRDGFDIDFFSPVDRARATNPEHYSISGYTRVWGGAYATPDTDRHRCKVLSVECSDDRKTAKLKVDSRKSPNFVYDISCRDVADPEKPLFPAYGFFTLHKIPSDP